MVATPIGHLGDLSPRAADTLRSVGTVAAEDTRETAKLVRHVGASPRLLSLHAHSPERRLREVVALLEAGEDVALTTDAGTPGVSDPGPAVVALARERGARVVPIPGPSAVHALLSVAGMPADRYRFAGFPPRRGPERGAWLAEVAGAAETTVCFEAPGRVAPLLADLAVACGPERRAVLGRELTKAYEEVLAGSLEALAREAEGRELRGECTLAVDRAPPRPAAAGDADLAARLVEALRDAGMEGRRAAQVVSAVTGLPRNASYRLVLEGSA